MTIGQAIEKKAKEKRYTVRELALKAKIDPQTIYNWTKGRGAPNVIPLIGVADVLGASLDELVGREKFNNPCRHCKFYPPSIEDGKPCLKCPAKAKEKDNET